MNHVVLTACIAELQALRYTPAGLPALDLRLAGESRVEEAGQARTARVDVKAFVMGFLAERIGKQPIGSVWRFTVFLATPLYCKHAVLHIQEWQQD